MKYHLEIYKHVKSVGTENLNKNGLTQFCKHLITKVALKTLDP